MHLLLSCLFYQEDRQNLLKRIQERVAIRTLTLPLILHTKIGINAILLFLKETSIYTRRQYLQRVEEEEEEEEQVENVEQCGKGFKTDQTGLYLLYLIFELTLLWHLGLNPTYANALFGLDFCILVSYILAQKSQLRQPCYIVQN